MNPDMGSLKYFSFVLFLTLLVICVSGDGEAENAEKDSSKESAELERDRRRTSKGYSNFQFASARPYNIIPPRSPISPLTQFSVFASAQQPYRSKAPFSLFPAKLTYTKSTKGESSGNRFGNQFGNQHLSLNPIHPFNSVNQQSYGFSPAPNYIINRPVLLSQFPSSGAGNVGSFGGNVGGFGGNVGGFGGNVGGFGGNVGGFGGNVGGFGGNVGGIAGGYQGSSQSSCSRIGPCVEVVRCAPFYEEIVANNQGCALSDKYPGVCCRDPQPGAPTNLILLPEVPIVMKEIPQQILQQAAQDAQSIINRRDQFEEFLLQNNVVVTDNRRPAYLHLQFFRTTPEAMDIAENALSHVLMGISVARQMQLSEREAGFGLQQFNVQNTPLGDSCPLPGNCTKRDKYYRTSTGACNNQNFVHFGEARTNFQRIAHPQYADGIYEPRVSVSGRPLPSARRVSASIVGDADRPDPSLTLSVMQWGQFIDHDLTHSPVFRMDNANMTGIECCDTQGQPTAPALRHPSCFHIEIPEDDPFYAQRGRRCLNFVRSMPAPRDNCTFGYIEQMNQLTHFLDGSAVYGSSTTEQNNLRTGRGGQLQFQMRGLLPVDQTISADDCFLRDTGVGCFRAGDSRVNETPQLAVVQTLWLRQHNRIAMELARLNPHWSDETLYQEARRIVAAQIQHIVYNEWLPLILGTDTSEKYGLLPQKYGYSGGYDPTIDPSILNEFATVAFRFGHTLVQGMLQTFNKKHQPTQGLQLRSGFNAPGSLYQPDRFDELVRGLTKQPMQSFDPFVTEDLQNRLFQTDMTNFGMDLIALNTQRGRDHGIPGYNALREACGLPRITNFHELTHVLRPEVVASFKNLYESVDDIDPFVAGISEPPVPGGVVGPLFNCIIRNQFARLKFGDRFYYENGGQPNSFTEAQLAEIKKTSWARIVCENTDWVTMVQPLAFRLPGPHNEKVPCSSQNIPMLDLTPWISERNPSQGSSQTSRFPY